MPNLFLDKPRVRQDTRQEDSNTVEIECVDYYEPENTETIRVSSIYLNHTALAWFENLSNFVQRQFQESVAWSTAHRFLFFT